MFDERRRAWITLIIWSAVMMGFLFLFFSGDNATEWGANHNKRFASALLFGLGYLTFFLVQLKGRREKKDERTFLIELKAMRNTLIITLLYVFIFGISLFVIYEKQLLMPAAWMWFLAYSTVFLTYIINSCFYLWFEKRVDGYGKY